jgi:hypothetical protein
MLEEKRFKSDNFEWSAAYRPRQLQLRDRFDEILVDRDKRCPLFVVDHDIGEIDEQSLLFVNRIRDAIPHGWNQKVAHVTSVHRADLDADLFPLGHVDLRYRVKLCLASAS